MKYETESITQWYSTASRWSWLTINNEYVNHKKQPSHKSSSLRLQTIYSPTVWKYIPTRLINKNTEITFIKQSWLTIQGGTSVQLSRKVDVINNGNNNTLFEVWCTLMMMIIIRSIKLNTFPSIPKRKWINHLWSNPLVWYLYCWVWIRITTIELETIKGLDHSKTLIKSIL